MHLQAFDYDLNRIRVALDENGEPWFCAKDAADAGDLDHANVRHFVASLSERDKLMCELHTRAGNRSYSFISEPALYRLMFRARSFEAERFTDWVTREVLPTIRRTGQYGGFQIPQNYAEALQVAADQAKRADEAEAALAIAAPKAETYDRYLGADGCHTMGTAAKILGTGRTRLFQWLRAQKIVPPKRTIPYQQYIEAGYFVIRAQTQERTDGTVSTFDAAAVTPKGLDWLQRKLNGLLEGIK